MVDIQDDSFDSIHLSRHVCTETGSHFLPFLLPTAHQNQISQKDFSNENPPTDFDYYTIIGVGSLYYTTITASTFRILYLWFLCFTIAIESRMSTSPSLLVAPSKAELPPVLCKSIVKVASEAISQNGMFSIALSGGSLPKFLGNLADAFEAQGLEPNWNSWHVFLADERCVPIEHEDSNLKAINTHFLDKVGIPKAQIYGIDAELTDKLAASSEKEAITQEISDKYEAVLKSVLPAPHTLDLAVLGFGPDGHTCSLFPGHPLLQETTKFVAPIVDSPKPPPCRITLTLGFLNEHTEHIIVCGAGASKNPIITAVFDLKEGDEKKEDGVEATCLLPKLVSPPPYPCSMVTPQKSLTWVVDADAMAGESK